MSSVFTEIQNYKSGLEQLKIQAKNTSRISLKIVHFGQKSAGISRFREL